MPTDIFYWRVRKGAVVVQRTEQGVWLLRPDDIGAKDGDLVLIEHGNPKGPQQ